MEAEFMRVPSSIRSLEPLTPRGYTLFLFLIFFFFISVNLTDIVFSVLSFSLIPCLVGVVTAVMLQKRMLRKRLQLTFHGILPEGGYEAPSTGSQVVGNQRSGIQAQVPVRYLIRTKGKWILPLFRLDLNPHFRHPLPNSKPISLSSVSSGELVVHFPVTFPHRGEWTLSLFECRIYDVFGLTSASWNVLPIAPASSMVIPQQGFYAELPTLSSESQDGDQTPDPVLRHGEPFDLKTYHPSDGLKRIVWKVFARTGQLISRYPETATTPEGRLFIYTVANRREDYVCDAAVRYMERLEESDLHVEMACNGSSDFPPASSSHEALQLFLKTVWASDSTTELADLATAIGKWSAYGGAIDHLVLCASKERAESPDGMRMLISLGQLCRSHSIRPSFFILEKNSVAAHEWVRLPHRHQEPQKTSLLARWFLPRATNGLRQTSRTTRELFLHGAREGWEIYEA